MAVMVALAAVVALIVLCVCLIYFPPFQNFAVKKAAGMLSDEMGMEISVGDVLLKWPLKLRVQEFKSSRVQGFKMFTVRSWRLVVMKFMWRWICGRCLMER